MSSQVNKIDINENSPRQTNKRTPAHFPDDAAPRSKRTPKRPWENSSSSPSGLAPGAKGLSIHGGPSGMLTTAQLDFRPAAGETPLGSGLAQRASLSSSNGRRYLPAQAMGPNDGPLASSPPPSPANTYDEQDSSGMLLQPETRPITHEQLVNEVKGVFCERSASF